jgi:hypothetical protein
MSHLFLLVRSFFSSVNVTIPKIDDQAIVPGSMRRMPSLRRANPGNFDTIVFKFDLL